MKWKYIIILLFAAKGMYASTYTLKEIMKTVKEHGSLTKSMHYEKLSLDAKNRADGAGDPFAVMGEGTRANPVLGKGGMEYSVGVSKKVMLPGVIEQEQHIRALENDAYMLEKEKRVLLFENDIRLRYHQHCLDAQNYRSFMANYNDFVTLYRKKEKAYRYQEISKMELIQLETEKNRLYAQLHALRMQKEISGEKVKILGDLPQKASTVFLCSDMYPIRSDTSKRGTFALSKEAYEKSIQSTKEKIKRYSRSIDTVDTYMQYTNELDVDRYSIGISVPLNFTSRRNEEERVAAMYRNSAIKYEFEQKLKLKQARLMQLRSELKSHAEMIFAWQRNLHEYQTKLFPMVRKSFDLGEISVLEYLMNRQKLYQMKEELYRQKEAYYSTLFRLYTVSETKDIK